MNLGANVSEVNIYRDGVLAFTRPLPLAGNTFTRAISELLGVPLDVAERLKKEAKDVDGQLERAYRLAFGREPAEGEKAALVEFVRKHGLAAACRLLLNANEFVFID